MRSRVSSHVTMLLVAAFAALAAACGSGQAVPDAIPVEPETGAQPPITGGGLPGSLSELLAGWKGPAADEFSEQNRFRWGSDYSADLPVSNEGVTLAGAHRVEFAPVAQPPQEQRTEAYATYYFPLAGYGGEGSLTFDWDEQHRPTADSGFWVGLGSYRRGAWEWRAGPLDGELTIGNLSDYLSAEGHLLVVVMLRQPGAYVLNWLRVGGNVPSPATIYAGPYYGPPGEVLIAVGEPAELALDDEVALIEFDLDGDGLFEIDSGLTNLVTTEFLQAGEHTVGARVTDSQGAVSTDSRLITVTDWAAQYLATGALRSALLGGDGLLHVMYMDRDAERQVRYGRVSDVGFTCEGLALSPSQTGAISIAQDASQRIWIAVLTICDPEPFIMFGEKATEIGWSYDLTTRIPVEPPEIAPYTELEFRFDPDDQGHLVYGAGVGRFDGGLSPMSYLAQVDYRWHWIICGWPTDSLLDLEVDSTSTPHFLCGEYGDWNWPELGHYTKDDQGNWYGSIAHCEFGLADLKPGSGSAVHIAFLDQGYYDAENVYIEYWHDGQWTLEQSTIRAVPGLKPGHINIALDPDESPVVLVDAGWPDDESPTGTRHALALCRRDGQDWSVTEIRRSDFRQISELELFVDSTGRLVIAAEVSADLDHEVPGSWEETRRRVAVYFE